MTWLGGLGNGAAGTIFYSLEFTNLSSRSCTLRGFPGVSGVNLRGGQVGRPARRVGGVVRTVTLRHGQTVSANLGIVQSGDFSPSSCRPVLAAGLRVYAPGQRVGKLVPFPYSACSHGQSNLTVGPVTHQAAV